MPSLRQRLKQLHLGEVYLEAKPITTKVKNSWGIGWSAKQVARSLVHNVFNFINDKDYVNVGSESEHVFVSSTAVGSMESLTDYVDLIDESMDLPKKEFMTAVACALRQKIIPLVVFNDRGIVFQIKGKTVTAQCFDFSSTIEGTFIFLLGCEPAFTSVLEDAVNELRYESRMEIMRLNASKARSPTVIENFGIALLVEAMNRFASNLATPSIQYAVAPAEVVRESKRDRTSLIDSVVLIDDQIFLAELGLAFSSFLYQHARITQQLEARVFCDIIEAVLNGHKELSRFENKWRETVQSIKTERANSCEEQSQLQWLASLSRERLVELAGRLSPDIVAQAKNDWELPF